MPEGNPNPLFQGKYHLRVRSSSSVSLHARVFATPAHLLPGRKGIPNVPQRRSQLGEMAAQNVLHGVGLHQGQALAGLYLGLPLGRDESVALEPPARHEDEHPECRIAESEALG